MASQTSQTTSTFSLEAFDAKFGQALAEARGCELNVEDGCCPACGDPSPRCQAGHTDRDREVLELHDEGDHTRCVYLI